MGINLEVLKLTIALHLYSLRNFHFSLFNPVFWAGLLLLFLLLSLIWKAKKAFSFCLILGIILLINTELENYLIGKFAKTGEMFDPATFRLFPLAIIAFIFLAYLFLSKD
ncbi:MAG: hypothetical protein PVI33_05190 [Candidatus Omnitrophota bacterium]|jgi:hypothetical protein